MTIQELENKLNSLRNKWKDNYPKSEDDPSWTEFVADKKEAEDIKTEIDKLKKAEETAKESDVICYHCQEKKALLGSLFPFCSPECKQEWQNDHYKNMPEGSKYKTVEECQKRAKELAEMKRGRML